MGQTQAKGQYASVAQGNIFQHLNNIYRTIITYRTKVGKFIFRRPRRSRRK